MKCNKLLKTIIIHVECIALSSASV